MGHIPQGLSESLSEEEPTAYQENVQPIEVSISCLAYLLLIYCALRSKRYLQIVSNQTNLNSS